MKAKGNGRKPQQTMMVGIYWAPDFVARLDAAAAATGRTRNDIIKELVAKGLIKLEKELLQVG